MTYIIEFDGEKVEIDEERWCSCCGDANVVLDTTMCPQCIIDTEKVFYESRFPLVEKMLSKEKAELFKDWSFSKKKQLVNLCIELGKII